MTIISLEWLDAEAAYLISLGAACADGVHRITTHLSLYEMGGDPFTSICLELVSQDAASIVLRD